MKILIISDSHGNIVNLKHVMGFANKINAEAVIHCGDWNTLESVETVLSYKIPLYSVIGNADIHSEISEELKSRSEKFSEDFLELDLDGRKIGIIHKINNLPPNNLDIVFFGHTHKQEEKNENNVRFINPGALENGINFAVYDTASNEVEFVNSNI